MDTPTATVITAGISAVVQIILAHHAASNPGAEPLTPVQALQQLQAAVAASLAEDKRDEAAVASASQLGIHAGSTGE